MKLDTVENIIDFLQALLGKVLTEKDFAIRWGLLDYFRSEIMYEDVCIISEEVNSILFWFAFETEFYIPDETERQRFECWYGEQVLTKNFEEAITELKNIN